MGVTFECDYPEEARTRRIVSTSAMPEGLTPAEIDAFVVAAMANGDDLYHLDEGALAGLDADLVVTQDLCAVCAVDVSVVDDALAHLGCTAEVLTIDPHTLDDVFASIETLGKATGHEEEATDLVRYQRRQLAACGAVGLAAQAARDVPGVDRPAVRTRSLDPGDDRARRRHPAAGHRRREVAARHVGRRARGPARRGGRRPVRLRPRGQPVARRRPDGEWRAAGGRTGPRRRRQRVLGPARHPAGRRCRGLARLLHPPTRS